jgi:hypothetical protein
LGTNLLKHAKGGEIWLLKEDDEYLLASLDKGNGIENLSWATQRGTTTYENSLGLGLYQLSQNDIFNFEIFTKKDLGSVFLLIPKDLNKQFVVLNENYIGLNVSGDFFCKKGRFFLLGDASGHGIKANKGAEFIKKYFLNNVFSCVFIDDFFKTLDKTLKEKNLRSAVLGICEVTKNKLNICGVGNISMIYKNNEVKNITFKDGIIGEAFSSASKYRYDFTNNSQFFMFSDGIDEKLMYNITKSINNIYLLVVCAIFYSNRMDDKIVLAIRSQK